MENLFLTVISGVLLFLIVLPIAMVVILSFSASDSLEFPPPGWGIRWYQQAWELMGEASRAERFSESIFTSFAIACTVMIIGVIVGVPASYALVRYRFPGKLLVEQLVSLPLVFPVVVLAIALLVMVSALRIGLGFWRIVAGHVIITLPFMIRNCTASLRGINPTLEEAARTLGAGWMRVFAEVVLPLMKSGILAGMMLLFILSFNEFTISYFLYTSGVIPFPVWLFSRDGAATLDPTIFSLSSVVIAVDILLIWALDRVLGKQGISV
jgi:putative spermidine/putrescine transport system permease protein